MSPPNRVIPLDAIAYLPWRLAQPPHRDVSQMIPSWKALIAVDREIIIRRTPSSENQSLGEGGEGRFSLAGLVSIRC